MQVKTYALAIAVCVMFGGTARAESGIASVYGNGDGYAGRKTASGARLNPHALTAAHRSLPFGTRVQITNRKNGRSAIVRISDRGPFIRGRVIDVTPAAARALGFSGLTSVSLTRVHG
jgi:rare lipoprotein A